MFWIVSWIFHTTLVKSCGKFTLARATKTEVLQLSMRLRRATDIFDTDTAAGIITTLIHVDHPLLIQLTYFPPRFFYRATHMHSAVKMLTQRILQEAQLSQRDVRAMLRIIAYFHIISYHNRICKAHA